MSIGKSSAIGLAASLMVLLLGILVSIVLTRSLGPEGRGVYALLATTNILMANLVHMSVASANSTYLGRGRFTLGEVNAVSIALAIGLGFMALVVITALYPLLSSNLLQNIPYPYLLVALLLIPSTIYQIYWSYMMMGLNRAALMSKVNLGVSLVSTILMVIVVGVLDLKLPGFLSVWAATSLASFISYLIIANRIERLRWPPSGTVARKLLNFGLRSHGASVAHHIFLRFDTYAINTVLGAAGVGYYSLATTLAERLWLPTNAVHSASLGKITQLPRDESALLTAKIVRAAILITISIALPFAALSPWLIPFLYGDNFTDAVLPFIILLTGSVSFAIMFVLNSYILGQMVRPGLLSIIAWVQLGVSVPLYLVLISWLGIVGAAIAATTTYTLAMLASLIVFTRDSHLSPLHVLTLRASDFYDYYRVLQRIWKQLPLLSKYSRRNN